MTFAYPSLSGSGGYNIVKMTEPAKKPKRCNARQYSVRRHPHRGKGDVLSAVFFCDGLNAQFLGDVGGNMVFCTFMAIMSGTVPVDYTHKRAGWYKTGRVGEGLPLPLLPCRVTQLWVFGSPFQGFCFYLGNYFIRKSRWCIVPNTHLIGASWQYTIIAGNTSTHPPCVFHYLGKFSHCVFSFC